MAQPFTHPFPVNEDDLWRALRSSLPRVTTQATFWEHLRRVAWSSDATPFSWGQAYQASIEAGPEGSSALTLSGKSRAWRSIGDRGRRAAVFETLVAGIEAALSDPGAAAMTGGPPTEDRVRYWNGCEWSVEPPTYA